jgi:hypothetical protein
MDLTQLTRHNIDERLRIEAAVDALGGRTVRPRVVALHGSTPVLVAEARDRHDGEDVFGPLFELLYLVSTVRPRGFVLGLPLRVGAWPDDDRDEDEAPFELVVLRVDRSIGAPRMRCVTHPFHVSELGLVSWGDARPEPVPSGLRMLGHAATRRRPRGRRRPPAMVARVLIEDGHRVELAPSLQLRFRTVDDAPR